MRQVQVNVPGKQVTVDYDPKETTLEAVRAQLEQSGFLPEERPAEPPAPPAPTPLTETPPKRRVPWPWLLALGIVALAVAGYAGYAVYPRFDLPAVEGITLLILAAGAGIASFFSPCAFPLLATLLARQTGMEAQQASGRRLIGRGLVFAAALSVGAAAFLLIGGLIIAAGGAALFAGVTFDSLAGRVIRTVVGVILIVLGLMQIGVLPNYFHSLERLTRPWARWQASYRRQASPVPGFAVFGFGYLLAGFG